MMTLDRKRQLVHIATVAGVAAILASDKLFAGLNLTVAEMGVLMILRDAALAWLRKADQ